MQARAEAIGERKIVHIAFAVHPYRPKLCVVTVRFGVLGQAETELTVKVIALLDVRREAIKMVDALNARAAMRFAPIPLAAGVALSATYLDAEGSSSQP